MKDHTEGFEKEARYHEWFGEVYWKHGLKVGALRAILE